VGLQLKSVVSAVVPKSIRIARGGRKQTQARAEFLKRVIPPNTIGAEIGVLRGEFSQVIMEVVQPKKLYLIDPWWLLGEKEWSWLTTQNNSVFDAVIGIMRQFETELTEGRVVLQIADALELLPTFPDHHFDWVYLDTTHAYDQTVAELTLLKQKVKSDGIIAGDDWFEDSTELHHGVCRAVREFVDRESYEILYASDSDHQWAIRRR
jgi:hypothetical protein